MKTSLEKNNNKIKEETLNSWEDFEVIIQQILEKKKSSLEEPQPLFRGHADSLWKLETTLERTLELTETPDQKYTSYLTMISSLVDQIETFTGKEWRPSPIVGDHSFPYEINSNYEYMTYLRHHGFPSPLLDWTYSPYIAAHFAFHNIARNVESVAIYVYKQLDYTNLNIHSLWDLEKVRHKRHHQQQSVYTVCVKKENDGWNFTNHEDEFLNSENHHNTMIKYILPASEWKKVSTRLESYNINAHSLMGTEESLLETLFERYVIDSNGRNAKQLYGSRLLAPRGRQNLENIKPLFAKQEYSEAYRNRHKILETTIQDLDIEIDSKSLPNNINQLFNTMVITKTKAKIGIIDFLSFVSDRGIIQTSIERLLIELQNKTVSFAYVIIYENKEFIEPIIEEIKQSGDKELKNFIATVDCTDEDKIKNLVQDLKQSYT